MSVSKGTEAILGLFQDMATSRKNNVDVVIINVATVIRNSCEKGILDSDAINSDMTALTTTASELLSRSTKNTGVVLFYLPDYKSIGNIYLKQQLPKASQQMLANCDQFRPTYKKAYFNSVVNNVKIFHCTVGGQKWPVAELLEDLGSTAGTPDALNVIMVSHMPVDWHIYKKVADFKLAESYTGKEKTIREVSNKVFGNESVPFNKYTHMTLGDKYLLNGVGIKEKRMVFEKASANQWNLMPEAKIHTDILHMGIVPANKFITSKL